MSFAGKVVLVTGGSAGIGAATAVAFAKEGARVAIIGRNESKLAKVKADCGGNALVLQFDISDDSQAVKAVEKTIQEFGQLDVLVNNAGVARYASILEGNCVQAYDEVMAVNLRAVLQLTVLATPHLIKTKGNIINMSGVWGIGTPKFAAALAGAMSKAALNHFTKIVAAELGSHGVRVNAISPGPVRTELLGDITQPLDHIKELTAMKQISEAEEVADVVLFLASDKAKSVTGSNYVIDNGMLLM